MTNPPFGSNVGSDQKVGGSDETRVLNDAAYRGRCVATLRAAWQESHDRMLAAATAKTNILDLFEIGKGKANRATEIVFVERCLELLKPGGQIGIVLPDGNLNNPSLTWLRRWSEGKARILAVVGLPGGDVPLRRRYGEGVAGIPEAVHLEGPEGVGRGLDRRPCGQ